MDKLVKANLKKGKAGLVVVTIFMLLAVFLLTVGITLTVKSPKLFEEKMAELDSPDQVLMLQSVEGIDFIEEIFEKVEALDYVEKSVRREYAIVADESYIRVGDSDWGVVRFLNKDDGSDMLPKFYKEADGVGIPIYLTMQYKSQNMVAAGTKITVKMQGKDYDAYIAGYFESVVHLYAGMSTMFTDGDSYQMMAELQKIDKNSSKQRASYLEMQFSEPYDYALRMKITKDIERIFSECRADYIENLKAQSPFPIPDELLKKIDMSCGTFGTEITVNAAEPYMLLLSVMMIVFSFVLTVVALIIVNFLIRAGIEDDMRNLGILKGLGYTTNQLRQSYLAEYGIVVAIGSLIGMIAAVCTMPVFERIMFLITNLPMAISANVWAGFLAIAAVAAISLLAVWYMTRRLKGITPLFALRGAISSHTFKKNAVPLEKSKAGLNVTLGWKTVMQNKRQSLMSFIIVAVMTLISAFTFAMYYNMNVDKTAMIALSGMENSDISYYVQLPDDATDADYEKCMELVKNIQGVERVVYGAPYGMGAWLNGEANVQLRASNYYDEYETNTVYDGRNPTLPTECAVSGDIKKGMNLRLGDVIRLKIGGEEESEIEKEFTVVGFSQGLYLQNTVSITEDGYLSIAKNSIPMFKGNYFVYLNEAYRDGFNMMQIPQTITNHFASRYAADEINISMSNDRIMIDRQVFQVVAPASELLLNVILVVTAIVIASVVFMIVRMKMLREKKNIAIFKSIGFKTFEIMNQTGLSMLIVSLPAALFGGLLGGLLVNPFMNLIGGFIGLYHVSFIVHFGYILLISLLLGLLNYAIALLVSLSTRFVTPRSIVSE